MVKTLSSTLKAAQFQISEHGKDAVIDFGRCCRLWRLDSSKSVSMVKTLSPALEARQFPISEHGRDVVADIEGWAVLDQ